MRIAVADLGTNSTRLLVADVTGDGGLTQIERHTTVTRLGEGVDGSGRLAPEATERVYAALARYREIADAAGAARRIAVATSAMRETENGPDLAARVREELGFDIRTIGGDEEARLTFLGATASRRPQDASTNGAGTEQAAGPARETLVIDIGGGSTELVSGRPGATPTFHVSTRLGSVRQTERHVAHDPPRHDELEALAAEAGQIIAAAVPADVRNRIADVIAVAGTPTSLAAIDQELDPYDPERVDGYRLELATAERILAELALLPLDQRRSVTGLHPDRAPTIVAGVVILVEALRLLGVNAVEVSESDILDGAALDAVLVSANRHIRPL
ncbi:MAG TPA: Ppx/GppA phosphatase family protein [Thermoleophilaceae bacterium]|nr:Ppx/GppA phosphatase family protein [Thermoleophilaceae bacterium]